MYRNLDSNSHKLTRMSSQICPTPEEQLLEAVLNNDLSKIEQLISMHEELLAHTYDEYQNRILHIACMSENVGAKVVELLLKLKADPRYCRDDDGREALHFAAQRTDPEVLQVLLTRNNVDVNALDSYRNNALQLLIRDGNKATTDFESCVDLLIKKGINLDHRDKRMKTASDWARSKGVYDRIEHLLDNATVQNNNLQNIKQTDYGHLMNYLCTNDLNSFKKHFCIDYSKEDTQHEETLLQVCCQKDLREAATYLIEQGVDTKATGTKNCKEPISIAADHGHSHIFDALLKSYSSLSDLPVGLLGSILQSIEYKQHDFKGCYKAFIGVMKNAIGEKKYEVYVKLNEIDSNGNPPLHYAIRYGTKEMVEELLNLGASLGAKNKFGVMPVHSMEPEMLRKHLDSCVKFDQKSKEIENDGFEVTFDYRTLIPPFVKTERSRDVEKSPLNTIKMELVEETEVIFFMSKAPEFKHLLEHPVIVSFLLMKWLRIGWLFWTNLAFYITFALSLVIYIFTEYAYFSKEDKSGLQNVFVHLSYICLIVTLLILMMRELFQIFVDPWKYLTNLENYIEIVLIIITSMIVFTRSPTNDTRKQLSSICVLLVAFELVMMLGHHPYFSTNVVMLRTVSFNFFKFLVWYSLLIIAFALSFYLLFTTSHNVQSASVAITNETTDEADDKSFTNPGRSVFKTIIMLTGEFDASDLNFETFPITSKVIFALFIFMIAIILVNLLNGLAVSDTQLIKNDADLIGHIARAQHVRYVESMLLGNLLPSNVVRKLSELCCCFQIPHDWNFKLNKIFGHGCLFPDYLDYELTIYPNRNGSIKSKAYKRKSCVLVDIRLDKDTIKRTNQIIRARKEEEENIERDQLRHEKLDLILAQLNVLLGQKCDTLKF